MVKEFSGHTSALWIIVKLNYELVILIVIDELIKLQKKFNFRLEKFETLVTKTQYYSKKTNDVKYQWFSSYFQLWKRLGRCSESK